MTKQALRTVSASIAREVSMMHAGRKTWNKVCGQWLVYGFERKLGFGNAVKLESDVETAWKKKTSVADAVYASIEGMLTAVGKPLTEE